jgi:choline dehydrogenase-like flavoprotein
VADLEAEFVVVGSGAGGGPLACRLAEAGHSVILLEAGGHDSDANVEVPAFHLFASEDPAITWAYYVSHYDDPERQRLDSKYQDGRGILYPRAAAVGGCTTHNALVTVYPHDFDWDQIASITGDPSWSARRMRRWFRKLEHCDYLDDGAARAAQRPRLPRLAAHAARAPDAAAHLRRLGAAPRGGSRDARVRHDGGGRNRAAVAGGLLRSERRPAEGRQRGIRDHPARDP